MKALFKSHFPFVEGTPVEELDPSQKLIKQTYDKLYQTKTSKADRLREVHGNDEPAEGAGKRK